jgi:DNA polymerase III epsilon subunit-like protein
MIALDVETTGTEPHLHSIISLGAVDTENPTNQFYDECRAWDGAHISDEALKINGFTKEEVTDTSKKTEEEVVKAFIAWAGEIGGDRTIVGQNSSFDRDFVKHACFRAHIEFPFAHRTLDTHTMAYIHMVRGGISIPVVNHRSAINLDIILEYCGIPEEPKPHYALTGALCHAEVATRLLYGKTLIKEFSQYPVPENLLP